MSQPPRPGQPNPSKERFGTLIETEEDIRQALLSGFKWQSLVLDDGRTKGEVFRLRDPRFLIG
jgi:hypothetical protein